MAMLEVSDREACVVVGRRIRGRREQVGILRRVHERLRLGSTTIQEAEQGRAFHERVAAGKVPFATLPEDERGTATVGGQRREP